MHKRTFAHYIVTRFNIGLWTVAQKTSRGEAIDPDRWMPHRIRLFRDICSRSIASQTERRFAWILLVDSETPRKFVKTIATIGNKAARIEIADRKSVV